MNIALSTFDETERKFVPVSVMRQCYQISALHLMTGEPFTFLFAKLEDAEEFCKTINEMYKLPRS